MAALYFASFLPEFSLVFPTYLCSALSIGQGSLFNHRIQKEILHHFSMDFFKSNTLPTVRHNFLVLFRVCNKCLPLLNHRTWKRTSVPLSSSLRIEELDIGFSIFCALRALGIHLKFKQPKDHSIDCHIKCSE